MKVLVTGGAASGKSEYAEKVLLSLAGSGEKLSIACMRNDSEAAKKRIARHRALLEGKGFVTIEKDTGLGDLTERVRGTSLLIEGAGMLLSNEMFSPNPAGAPENFSPAAGGQGLSVKTAVERTVSGISTLLQAADQAVLVTDEIFSDGRDYDELTMAYIRALGEVNRRLAALCDRRVEVVYSYPVEIF